VAETAQPISPEGAKARVLVAGATGYAGALAAELAWQHPRLELAAVTGRSETGTRLNDLYPRYSVSLALKELDEDDFDGVDAGIVAYPHGAAAPVVARMREKGMRVVDLSADFRLKDRDTYEKYYGAHGAPDLFGSAAYGLTELDRKWIRDAELVANPGCYPTATLLGLAPLARAGLIEDVVVSALSGVSGAGRGGGESTSFVTVTENVSPYKPVGHRHLPEIREKLGLIASAGGNGDGPERLTFVPHLVPLDQGELVSCYVTPRRELGQPELDEIFAASYEDEPFIRLRDVPPGMRDVRETNQCHIMPLVGDDRIVVFSAIDNLWKGASSQAIQNLNLMLGLDETEGLR